MGAMKSILLEELDRIHTHCECCNKRLYARCRLCGELVCWRVAPTLKDAPASRDGRACVRHDQGAHGGDALPDEDAAKGCQRNGPQLLAYNLTRVMNIVASNR